LNDIDAWMRAVLAAPSTTPDRREAGVRWASRFTWERFVTQMTGIYARLLERHPATALAEVHA
jgi:hypothetical protein